LKLWSYICVCMSYFPPDFLCNVAVPFSAETPTVQKDAGCLGTWHPSLSEIHRALGGRRSMLSSIWDWKCPILVWSLNTPLMIERDRSCVELSWTRNPLWTGDGVFTSDECEFHTSYYWRFQLRRKQLPTTQFTSIKRAYHMFSGETGRNILQKFSVTELRVL